MIISLYLLAEKAFNVCSGFDLYFAERAKLLCLLFGGGEGEVFQFLSAHIHSQY